MHTRQFEKEYWYKCERLGCKSSFQFQGDLNIHHRIHNNDLDVCSYCHYRYVDPAHYKRHLKKHFGIRDYECDQCDWKFFTQSDLNRHYQRHEGIIYSCLICKNYDANARNNIESHLRSKHADIVGKHHNWGVVKHHVKIKN